MPKSAVKLTPTERLNRAIGDIECVLKTSPSPATRDAIYDYVYGKLEEIENNSHKVTHKGVRT